MKTNTYYFVAIFLVFALIACNEDNLLNEEPQHFLTPDVTYNTDAGLAAGAVGLYDHKQQLFFDSGLMRDYQSLANAGTDFMRNGRQPSRRDIVQLNDGFGPVTSDGNLSFLWIHYYGFVNNATTILDRSAEHEWSNQSLKERTEGEAHFFRAWGHLWLTMLWGDVPVIRESVQGVKEDFEQTAQAEVLKFVIEDFQAAADLLPMEEEGAGRLTKGAAKHMLAYAYLCTKDYQNAEVAAQEVIDNPKYNLVSERFGSKASRSDGNPFWDLFQLNNHNENPEAIWVFQNGNADLTPQIGTSPHGGPAMRHVRIFNSRIEVIPGLSAGPEYGGRGFTRFSATMPYFDLFEPGDDRGEMPVLQKRFTAIETGNIDGQEVNIGDLIFDFDKPETGIITDITDLALRPWPTKWLKEHDPADSTKFHPEEVGYTGGTIRDHYNIRLAETYLILAEAQHMQGKNADAAININLVRERSGASPISAGDVSIDFILDEKARELWGEWYSRKVELVRTGKYVERIQAYNPEAGPNVQEKHRLLPIPQSEIDLNRKNPLDQNPDW